MNRMIMRVSLLVLFAALCGVCGLWFLGPGASTVEELRAYAPTHQMLVSARACLGSVSALPISDLQSFRPMAESERNRMVSQLSRTLQCSDLHRSNLLREGDEVALSLRIRYQLRSADTEAIYLNRLYFGDATYGVDSASQTYFGKPAASLTTADVALLDAIAGSPNAYSPFRHPDRALRRRNEILGEWQHAGFLSAAAETLAERSPLNTLNKQTQYEASTP